MGGWGCQSTYLNTNTGPQTILGKCTDCKARAQRYLIHSLNIVGVVVLKWKQLHYSDAMWKCRQIDHLVIEASWCTTLLIARAAGGGSDQGCLGHFFCKGRSKSRPVKNNYWLKGNKLASFFKEIQGFFPFQQGKVHRGYVMLSTQHLRPKSSNWRRGLVSYHISGEYGLLYSALQLFPPFC